MNQSSQLRLWLPEESAYSVSPAEGIVAQFDAYIAAKKLAPGTISEYRTTQRKLIAWSSTHRCTTPMGFLQNLGKSHIADFLSWVAENTTGTNVQRTVNKAAENLRALLRWIEDTQPDGGDWRSPRFPDLEPAPTTAAVVSLSREEVGRLYLAAGELPDPPAWNREGCGPYAWQWQAALVLMVTYGLDTGTIWLFGRSRMALRWCTVYFQPRPPSRSGELPDNPAGWIVYKRQKVSPAMRSDQTPMERPLTPQAAWQLHRLHNARPGTHPRDLVFRRPVGTHGQRPSEIFRRLCATCGIDPAMNLRDSEPVSWTLKHLRKTCATWHNGTIPGSASAVLGHMPENLQSVTAKHYVNTAPLAARVLLATEYPPEFPVESLAAAG